MRSLEKCEFAQLAIPGVLLVKPRKHADARGFFMESYALNTFRELGIDCVFVQDNHSLSKEAGTIRGLHFQRPPMTQAKLVRVIRGAIFDVAVDLRRGSATYGQWCAATLTAEGAEQLFVPHGFAHGFCTLEADTEVVYKVDDYYSAEHDAGVRWNDPDLNVAWPVTAERAVLSAKDDQLPLFRNLVSPFHV